MITQDFIVIKKRLPEVYKTAQDIKNQHEYIPGYKPSKIIETKEDGRLIIERTAEMDGKIMKWKSMAEFDENKTIKFEQLEGKLKGMKINWLFEETGEETKVTIIHDFKLKIPLLGWFAERFIAKPKIDRITRNVLTGLKNKLGGIIS